MISISWPKKSHNWWQWTGNALTLRTRLISAQSAEAAPRPLPKKADVLRAEVVIDYVDHTTRTQLVGQEARRGDLWKMVDER